MRKSNRIRSSLLPGHDTLDDLPAPTTSRPLLPRSRAASSASASRHGSRGSSRSNSSRRSLAMEENINMAGPDIVVSPIATSSSPSLNMDENIEAGGSLSASLLKRKRSSSDVAVQDEKFLLTLNHSDLSHPESSSASSVKGKGKSKELHLQTPDSSEAITIFDTSDKETSEKGKQKALYVEPKPKKPKEELLGSYSCPICLSPPSNATLTPCGHICCGLCLFMAVKTTMQRSATTAAPEGAIARCPVCRATIPGWDGKGGGVIGLKARAILTL